MKFIFLLSSERSGSNLLSKIVDSHSQFCGPFPSHMIRTFSQNILKYGDLKKDENWEVLASDVVELLNTQLGKWHCDFTPSDILNNAKRRDLGSVIKYVYEKEAKAQGKNKIFLKENHTYRFLSFLQASFPDAKYVYLVRDPRDVCLSWKVSTNHPGGIKRGAIVWKEDQTNSLLVYGYLWQLGRIHMIKYEDLVSDTERVVRELCDFLEVDYKPSMLSYYKSDLTLENTKRLKDWENLRKPVLSENFNKYRKALSSLEIQYIEHYCREEMKFLNYQFDFPQDLVLEDLEEGIKAIEDQIQKPVEKMSDLEQDIREKRLDVISTIKNRDLSF